MEFLNNVLRLDMIRAISCFHCPIVSIGTALLASAVISGLVGGGQIIESRKQRKSAEKQTKRNEQAAERAAADVRKKKATDKARQGSIVDRRAALARQGRARSLAAPKGGTLLTSGPNTSQTLLGGGMPGYKTLLGS